MSDEEYSFDDSFDYDNLDLSQISAEIERLLIFNSQINEDELKISLDDNYQELNDKENEIENESFPHTNSFDFGDYSNDNENNEELELSSYNNISDNSEDDVDVDINFDDSEIFSMTLKKMLKQLDDIKKTGDEFNKSLEIKSKLQSTPQEKLQSPVVEKLISKNVPKFHPRFRDQDDADEMQEINLQTFEMRHGEKGAKRGNRLSLEAERLANVKENYRKSAPGQFGTEYMKSYTKDSSIESDFSHEYNREELELRDRMDYNYQTFDMRHGEKVARTKNRLSNPTPRLKSHAQKMNQTAPSNMLKYSRVKTQFPNKLSSKQFEFADNTLEYDEDNWGEKYIEDSIDSVNMSTDKYNRYGKLDLSDILNEKSIKFDKFPSKEYQGLPKIQIIPPSPEKRSFIEDQYYPGIIDDAVNRRIDFNSATKEKLSLIEAFDLRVKYEQANMKNIFTQYWDSDNSQWSPHKFGRSGGDSNIIPIRDENVRISTAALDVSEYMRKQPENELIKAITCLSRAQELNDFPKMVRAAEDAVKNAKPEDAEIAAIYGARTFRIDNLTTKVETIPGTKVYKPLEIVSYMGITENLSNTRPVS